MPYLSWISDEVLEKEVESILCAASQIVLEGAKKIEKSVLDPFSAIFEMAGFEIDGVDEWRLRELGRQNQKALANKFGEFHQNLLSQVDGWSDFKNSTIVDVCNRDRKIIAEIKNKYNTLNAAGQAKLFQEFEHMVMHKSSAYVGYVAYYVEIIPKTSKLYPTGRYDIPYTPSNNATGSARSANSNIRKIDGRSFYSLVTGSPSALEDLYVALPDVISNVNHPKLSQSVRTELKKIFHSTYPK